MEGLDRCLWAWRMDVWCFVIGVGFSFSLLFFLFFDREASELELFFFFSQGIRSFARYKVSKGIGRKV